MVGVGAGCIVLGFALLMLGDAFVRPGLLSLGGGVLLLIMMGALSNKRRRLANEAQRKAEREYRPAIARAKAQIQTTQRRIAELEADMDRLAREL